MLSAEYLRVLSPSAEVRGHHPDQAVLQTGKKDVGIQSVVAIGNYAVQIIFDDQHDSGIYAWEYLYRLCVRQKEYWQNYLEQLNQHNKFRDANVEVIKL